MVHQWTERLVEQEIRIGILRLSRIGENKIYRPFRYRVIDDRKRLPGNYVLETVHCLWKRRPSELNGNNPRVIADFHW